LYRQCNQPITSFGCIVYRLVYDRTNNTFYPEYLMVQRKDSLAYVEFIRGKYNLENCKYIKTLLSHMTRDELEKLRSEPFDKQWNEMWSMRNNKNYAKEQKASEDKFNQIHNGYMMRGLDDTIREVRLNDLVDMEIRMGCMTETEWGFPKGRRNHMESDKRCAIREFREETGISANHIRIKYEKPVDEIFIGTNNVRYKHVYYIAKYVDSVDKPDYFDPDNKHQAREVKSVRWFGYKDAHKNLESSNTERRELLKRVNNIILRHHINDMPPK
jgi:8-oxo-dGTP pyrophosphatase MutT (NUDIX family)